uniref:Uncharacterized protein n=1 Tax=Sphaerodactylus townsendi TaxID=933632 RepID=A0ACB8EKI3_9SAUR
MAAAKKSVLSSLAVYAEDSEPESGSETGGAGSERGAAPEEKGGLVSEGYGEDDCSKMDGEEDGYDEDDDENSKQSVHLEVSFDGHKIRKEDDDSETEKPEAGDLKVFGRVI